MIDIVIPTIGRPSLRALLASLAASAGPLPNRIFIVDDRPGTDPLDIPLEPATAAIHHLICTLGSGGRGPAAARNCGWRASAAQWLAFLDDDVVVSATWLSDLVADIEACSSAAAASQGQVAVPLPKDRRATDWERNVAGLETARWITADCAYRRHDLLTVGGFDERFPRAFREDADLALRVIANGGRIVAGQRRVLHPVRPASPFISIAQQAGNADDVLMEALHGPDWYERAGAPRGALKAHLWTVGWAVAATVSTVAWLVWTLRFALCRIAPGPRTSAEVRAMLLTSVVIPFAAVGHRIAGYARLRRMLALTPKANLTATGRPRAVLFDRDGTLVEDVPYNGDPTEVRPVRGARAALERLRSAGIAIGIVSNQSGIALGKISAAQVAAVNARLYELVGPFDTVAVCPHAADGGCDCRKPAPGLILKAARALGVPVGDCVVIGDIGTDIDAARAAGASAILVPTPVTRAAEIAAAEVVAASLGEAVDLVLGNRA